MHNVQQGFHDANSSDIWILKHERGDIDDQIHVLYIHEFVPIRSLVVYIMWLLFCFYFSLLFCHCYSYHSRYMPFCCWLFIIKLLFIIKSNRKYYSTSKSASISLHGSVDGKSWPFEKKENKVCTVHTQSQFEINNRNFLQTLPFFSFVISLASLLLV